MNNVAELIERTQERFVQIAPETMRFDAERGYALQALSGNDYLTRVAMENKTSLLQAMHNVAGIGLSLNPAEKLCYLVPRKQGKGKPSAVCLDISYMGFCRLATNSGSVQWIQAEVVYSNDEFRLNGVGERPTHNFDPFATEEQRGEFVGVYCVAKTADGDYLTTPMSAEEVNRIRDKSEAWKAHVEKGYTCPWVTHPNEMRKKTVVKRAFKMWPKTDKHSLERMALAVQSSHEAEGYEDIVTAPKLTPATGGQKEHFDQLIESENALEMYVFLSTIGESARNDLYHSFEKGTKGKYQRVVDSLYAKGASEFEDYLALFGDAIRAGDDLAIQENVEELSESVIDYLVERMGPEGEALKSVEAA